MGTEVYAVIRKKIKGVCVTPTYEETNKLPLLWWAGGSNVLSQAILTNVDIDAVTLVTPDLMKGLKDFLEEEKNSSNNSFFLYSEMVRYAASEDERWNNLVARAECEERLKDIEKALELLSFWEDIIDNDNEIFVAASY